jgi:DNA/RNA-binding domain of Phe-tRNA-synthetase-like protein
LIWEVRLVKYVDIMRLLLKTIVQKEVFEMFPDYIRGVVIARNINNIGENPDLVQLLREIEQKSAQDISLGDVKNHPRIFGWRQAYSKFGINPNKYYCSIESLCRRVRKGSQLPYINTAVALFNYFSLKYIVPSGGDDLGNVKGDLALKVAKGNEIFTPFNSESIEYPSPGEVIYVDGPTVMCRCWNWRQGNQTKLTPETRDIAINVDCLPPFSKDDASMMIQDLEQKVKLFCGGEIKSALLSANKSEYDL